MVQLTINYGKLFISDGENFVNLNFKKEIETIEKLREDLPEDMHTEDLVGSLYQINGFSYSYHWDYNNKEVIISVNTDSFRQISPANTLEIHRKDRNLNFLMTKDEKEEQKRRCLQSALPSLTPAIDFSMDDLLGVESTLITEEEKERAEAIQSSIMKGIFEAKTAYGSEVKDRTEKENQNDNDIDNSRSGSLLGIKAFSDKKKTLRYAPKMVNHFKSSYVPKEKRKDVPTSDLVKSGGWIKLPNHCGHTRRGGYFQNSEEFKKKCKKNIFL